MKKLPLVLASVVLLLSASALAQTPEQKKSAAEAYGRGVEAHKKGDFQRAATEFAAADAIAPSSVALQAALDASVDADDPALGSELIERSARGPVKGDLAKSVDAAKKKFAGRAGKLNVACPSGSTCLATLDGAATPVGKPTWTRAGQHTVVVQIDGEAQTKLVEVAADRTTEVVSTSSKAAPATAAAPAPAPAPAAAPASAPAPATAPAPAPATKHGLSPVVFWVGFAATGVFGVTSLVFGRFAGNKHDDFISAGCDKVGSSDCDSKAKSGKAMQTYANVGFGITAVGAVATAVIGIAFTDWGGSGSAASAPILAPVAGGAVGGWSGRF